MIHGHQPTQQYLARRRTVQKTGAEIRRCLKRTRLDTFTGLMESNAGGVDRPRN
jgi:hypothetical protein